MRTRRAMLLGLGLTSISATASAEPGILYVPDEDINLEGAGLGDCALDDQNSATNCTLAYDWFPYTVHPQLPLLLAGLDAALAPYDVYITTERPPPYLPYTLLLASEEESPFVRSSSCTAFGTVCGAADRNEVILTVGMTASCPSSEPVHAALHAFGRVSGLEPTSDATDPMGHPPDFGTPVASYVDGCADILPLPLPDSQCDAALHVGCVAGQQNSHAELLARYGPRTVDTDPPQLTNVVPEAGALLLGGDLLLDVEVSDADPVVGLRWTIASPALEARGIEGGTLTHCTNQTCDGEWADGAQLKATGSDFSVLFEDLPPGTYEVTVEAADYHGNVAEAVMRTVEVSDMRPPSGSSDGPGSGSEGDATGPLDTGGGGTNPPPPMDTTTAPPSDSSEGGGDEAGQTDDAEGCGCRSSAPGPDGPWWWLLALPLLRRRGA